MTMISLAEGKPRFVARLRYGEGGEHQDDEERPM
jgi:hypothetical protein